MVENITKEIEMVHGKTRLVSKGDEVIGKERQTNKIWLPFGFIFNISKKLDGNPRSQKKGIN